MLPYPSTTTRDSFGANGGVHCCVGVAIDNGTAAGVSVCAIMNVMDTFEFMPFSVPVIEDPEELGVDVVVVPPKRRTPWLLLWSHFDPCRRSLEGMFGRRT